MPRSWRKSGGGVTTFYITGGEPLLHPQLTDIFDIARKYFPAGKIFFMTNGILLPQMPETFWENMRENRIEINISKYPIKIDLARIAETAERYGVKCDYVGGKDVPVKKMWKYPLDIEGKQPLRNSYNLCTQLNVCMTVKDGVIYPCNIIAGIRHFNRQFGKQLELTPDDTFDLHKANSSDELLKFLSSPKPFCRYCNRRGITLGIEYGQSKKEISEWT